MDRAGWHYPSGDLRVSDADRDQALSELRDAHQVGRITADEFDERAGQALAARTGTELTALLADLPAESPRTPATVPERSDRFPATRIAMVASATGAAFFALVAAGAAALSQGPSLQQLEFMREQMASRGLHVPPSFPTHPPPVDWAGVITPGVIAVLLGLLAVCLGMRMARANRA